jgi:hypothetical protein
VTALGLNTFLSRMKAVGPLMPAVNFVSGLFLIAVGVLITTNSLSILSAYLTKLGVGWSIGQ